MEFTVAVFSRFAIVSIAMAVLVKTPLGKKIIEKIEDMTKIND